MVLEEVEVVAEDALVDVPAAALDVPVDGVTLDVVVSEEETPADCVAVEPPPQPAKRTIARRAAKLEAVRFVGIGGSAYPKGARAATPEARRF